MKDPLITHIIVTHRNNIDTYTFLGYYVCIKHWNFQKKNSIFYFIQNLWLLYNSCKELGPRTAKLALSIFINMKMVKYVWESTDSANAFPVISFLYLWRHFQTGSSIMVS